MSGIHCRDIIISLMKQWVPHYSMQKYWVPLKFKVLTKYNAKSNTISCCYVTEVFNFLSILPFVLDMCKWALNANMFYSICGHTPLSTREIKLGDLVPTTLDAVLWRKNTCVMAVLGLDSLHRFIIWCWGFVVAIDGRVIKKLQQSK